MTDLSLVILIKKERGRKLDNQSDGEHIAHFLYPI